VVRDVEAGLFNDNGQFSTSPEHSRYLKSEGIHIDEDGHHNTANYGLT